MSTQDPVRLRALRGDRSPTKTAAAADVSVPTLNRAENGHPVALETIYKLARHYGVTVDELLVHDEAVVA